MRSTDLIGSHSWPLCGIDPRPNPGPNRTNRAQAPFAPRAATLRTQPFTPNTSSSTISTHFSNAISSISSNIDATGDQQQQSGTAPEVKSTQSPLGELEIVTSSGTHNQLSPADSLRMVAALQPGPPACDFIFSRKATSPRRPSCTTKSVSYTHLTLPTILRV